jgi:hypothetical protein
MQDKYRNRTQYQSVVWTELDISEERMASAIRVEEFAWGETDT